MTPEGWRQVSVLEACERTGRVPTVPRTEYQAAGALPIVDQGKGLIGGFTDAPSARYPGPLPVFVFGDHTREWKFIDFPFAAGADGTQLLRARAGEDQRFVFEALRALPLQSLGYSRHFKLLKELTLLLPPPGEQRKIAAILSAVDDAIEATQAVIEQLQVVKKAMIAELLTHGLPHHAALGPSPSSWAVRKLPEVCRPRQWPTISKDQFTAEGYPVFGANGQIGWFSSFNHEMPTIAITCRGATCGSINVTPPRSYVTGNAMCLDDLDPRVDIRFLAAYLEYVGVQRAITGSAQPQITRESLAAIEVEIPPIEEQAAIAGVLVSVDALIASENGLAQAARDVKAGLVHTLLSGAVRVTPDGQE